MSPIRRAYFYFEYVICRAVILFISCLPMSLAEKLAEITGALLFKFLRKRREITLMNLQLAFGHEKSEKEIYAIARASWKNLVKVAVEVAYLPKIAQCPEKYFGNMIHPEYLWDSLAQGKGIIFIISHLGNWELLGMGGSAMGLPLHTIARPMNNPFIYRYVKKLRSMTGTRIIDKSGAVKETMKLIHKHQCIAMLVDQHNSHGVWVRFFGRQAATTSLPAMMALRAKIPVVAAFIHRLRLGYSVIEIAKPFECIQTKDFEESVAANTEQYMQRIEEEIRRNPGNWLWMHRRWREKPKS